MRCATQYGLLSKLRCAINRCDISIQKCTQEVIQTLQILDTSVPLDPMGKTINEPIGLCDNELLQQRSPLQDPFNVPAPNSAALAVPSVESINTQKNILTAKAAYETVLASEVPLLLTPNQTTVQTAANTRANGVPQCAQMQLPARSQVSYAHPNSRTALPQSQLSRLKFRLRYLLCMPLIALANVLMFICHTL
jgi:hypothetical protein